MKRAFFMVFISLCLHFHINISPQICNLEAPSRTIMLMAYTMLLFHYSVCFLTTQSAHFADALTISHSYSCQHSAVILNLDFSPSPKGLQERVKNLN